VIKSAPTVYDEPALDKKRASTYFHRLLGTGKHLGARKRLQCASGADRSRCDAAFGLKCWKEECFADGYCSHHI
jgi:hypothetical protein